MSAYTPQKPPGHAASQPARSPGRPKSIYSTKSTIRPVTPSPEPARRGIVREDSAPISSNQPLVYHRDFATVQDPPSRQAETVIPSLPQSNSLSVIPTTSRISRIPKPTSAVGLARSNVTTTPTPSVSQRQHRVLTPRTWAQGRVDYYGSTKAKALIPGAGEVSKLADEYPAANE